MSDVGAPSWLPYSTQWLDDDDIAAVVEVLRGDWLTTGPAVEAFERALVGATGVKQAVAVTSGTAALHAIYAAANLGPGRGIVTSPLTFVATASTALMLGAEVRFADIDPVTGTLDPEAARDAVSRATRLLVGVDYAGHPADYERLREVAAARELRLVADAAHSLGASCRGRPAVQLVDAAALSFHPVKTITTAEGGAALTDDDEWCEGLRRFRNHGIVRDRGKLGRGEDWYYEVQSLGLNYRLPDVLCALGISQMRKLGRFLERRRELAAYYERHLAGLAALELPAVREGIGSAWHLYVLRVREEKRREAFFSYLREHAIGAQVHYQPVYFHRAFRDLGYRRGACPLAEDFAARAVSIPLYPKLSDADAARVVDVVASACRAVL